MEFPNHLAITEAILRATRSNVPISQLRNKEAYQSRVVNYSYSGSSDPPGISPPWLQHIWQKSLLYCFPIWCPMHCAMFFPSSSPYLLVKRSAIRFLFKSSGQHVVPVRSHPPPIHNPGWGLTTCSALSIPELKRQILSMSGPPAPASTLPPSSAVDLNGTLGALFLGQIVATLYAHSRQFEQQ